MPFKSFDWSAGAPLAPKALNRGFMRHYNAVMGGWIGGIWA
jgi:hypothetical protein